ncbi:MAG: fumarylacetoacetate hydrolase family protein [Polyangiales bacterium]
MKLVTYVGEGGNRHGALLGDRILDLVAGIAAMEKSSAASVAEKYGKDLLGLIERQDVAMPVAREAVRRAAELPASVFVAASKVTLLSPIPRPPSMRDGYAFRQHVQTARKNRGLDMIPEFDQFPVFYFTNHQAVVGPGPVRVMPLHLEKLDFELEAAIVVGRRGRNVKADKADSLIFGLTIMNDLSARVLQMEEMKLSLGPAKGKDFATALGPYLLTIDELEDKITRTPNGAQFDLVMTAKVNGIEVSRGNVKDMNWTFAQILERASYGVDLYPGDVIGSGTVGTGCFLELNGSGITKNQWLKLGDVCTLEIERLGTLENTFVADEA